MPFLQAVGQYKEQKIKEMRITLIIALILSIQIKAPAQIIAGRITDSKTNEPLDYIAGELNQNG
ncbi:MAG: hypothetical protein L3J31_01165 [Bacteroidales bacterium]|nr:hypothetical protein [Bacteroidales bacterium]MCF6341399.1 hypothetical protein [Bacteroidales bacterium]